MRKQWKAGKHGKWGLVLLTVGILMILGMAPGFAEEAAIGFYMAETAVPEETGLSNDAAAAGYISRIMAGGGSSPAKLRARGTLAGASLSGADKNLYDALKTLIPQVAGGQISSTEFLIPLTEVFDENIVCTAEELGVDSITEETYVTARTEFSKKIPLNLGKVMSALLADYPYELFWFDKTEGMASGYSVSYTETAMQFGDFENGSYRVLMYVAQEYSLENQVQTTSFDTAKYGSASTAAANARAIVTANAGKGNYAKLQAYKEAICERAEYNSEAAGNKNTPYGNPWQMIWVFDDNPNTTVVCEGYSKAFQFLCDESTFSGNVYSIIATGEMNGGTGAGGHMWNIVTMTDGKKYMADITNSDQGTIGQNGGLFLDGYDDTGTATDDSNNVYTIYYYDAGSGRVGYIFDSDTTDLYSDADLNMSASAYDPDTEYSDYVVENGVLTGYTGSASNFTIPAELGVTAIGDDLFWNKSWLNTVTIPEGVVSIGERAFRENYNLTSITLPESLRSIGYGAFAENSNLRSINIPEGATTFGNDIFHDDYSLASVSLPEGMTVIPEGMFQNCRALTELRIPESVTEIGNDAFSGCSALTLSIPEETVTIGNAGALTGPALRVYAGSAAQSFCASNKLSYKIIGNMIDASADAETLLVGEETVLHAATEPDAETLYAYLGSTPIGSWTREQASPTYYDADGIPRLQWAVTIRPEQMGSVITVRSAPAGKPETGASKYVSLIVHNDDGYAVGQDGTLLAYVGEETDLVIPENLGITNLNGKLRNNTRLQYVTLPTTLTCYNTGTNEFSGCSALKLIRYPKVYSFPVTAPYTTVEYRFIGTIISGIETDVGSLGLSDPAEPKVTFTVQTDAGADYLTLLDGSGNTLQQWTAEGNSTTEGWTRTWTVTYTFAQYKAQSCKFNSGRAGEEPVTTSETTVPVRYSISSGVLTSFTDRDEVVVIPDGLGITSIGPWAWTVPRIKTQIKSLVLPEGITSIPAQAFQDCTALMSITLPETVTKIGDEAFSGTTALGETYIPESVTSIGSNSFAGSSATLSYPCGSYAEGWVNGQSEITGEAIHTWGEPEYIWAEDYSSVTAVRRCLRDEVHHETETVVAGFEWIKEPTWTEPGAADYTSQAFESPAFTVQQKKNVKTKPLREATKVVAEGNTGTPDEYNVAGDNATYKLYANGYLEIEGSGDLYSYVKGYTAWDGDEPAVEKYIISDGITYNWPEHEKPMLLYGDIDLQDERLVLEREDELDLSGTFHVGLFFCEDRVEITSVDPDILRVQDQVLTAVKKGETEIIVSAADFPQLSMTIPVTVLPLAGDIDPESLEKLTLPAGLTRIEDEAFEGGAFEAVIIPDGCEYIGHGAFRNCGNLIYVSLPAGTTVEEDAFEGIEHLIREIRTE